MTRSASSRRGRISAAASSPWSGVSSRALSLLEIRVRLPRLRRDHGHVGAPVVQVARRNQTVPAVVPGSREHDDLTSFEGAQEHPRFLRSRQTGLLHELRLGRAGVDRGALQRPASRRR